ncbi:hypothetical protein [Psychromicrobium xiongbiense]|uniref:hypothetical protein n=1 Tax=Psychromicrobium xiongbiense TaxID=3051184 RepID=UPI0025555098|nr:hypothetical protein [Psychromicrobium sp. YIM S02556]
MTERIIVLTETALTPMDVQNLQELVEDAPAELTLLVEAEPRRNLLVDVIDQLSLLDIPAALKEFRPRPSADEARANSEAILQSSLAALAAAGLTATGKLVEGDAVAGLIAEVGSAQARQAVVVTEPHALEDTFHTDWASQAQHKLGLPVLHLYSGSGFIGES